MPLAGCCAQPVEMGREARPISARRSNYLASVLIRGRLMSGPRREQNHQWMRMNLFASYLPSTISNFISKVVCKNHEQLQADLGRLVYNGVNASFL